MDTFPNYPLIAITQGDAAGIGPEIIVKSFAKEPRLTKCCIVVASPVCIQRALMQTQLEERFCLHILTHADVQSKKTLTDFLNGFNGEISEKEHQCFRIFIFPFYFNDDKEFLPHQGQIDRICGQQAANCITWAAHVALHGTVDAIVTAPIHKESLSQAGIAFPGHTELLQALAATYFKKTPEQVPVRMMLANSQLRVVLLSIHTSLRNALKAVTVDNIVQTLQITHVALSRILGRAPRIAVAGLNPHAGEGGLFGDEELQIIHPAIQMARAEGIDVSGSYPADTIFMRSRSKKCLENIENSAMQEEKNSIESEFDVVLAMYHDQGLIPIKYWGIADGVNVTLGLPFIRTSPDHGTAFDITGTGMADESSMLQAIEMAKQMHYHKKML